MSNLTARTWPYPPRAFHVMVKPRGSICNLDCQYCFYLKKEKLYPDSSFRMSDEVLESYTRQYIEAQSAPEVTFAWQGGEPTLMGVEFFRKAVAFQEKYRRPGMKILNAFQTNGTLLDDAWGEFLHAHDFLIGLSLDGPGYLHDTYRQDKGGRPTFERVMRGLGILQKHRVEFNTLTCVSAANAGKALEVYRFLRDEAGSRYMQFIPIVERDNESGFQEGARLTRRSVAGPQYGRFLIDIFDEWVRSDVGRVYVQIFDVSLARWAGERPGLCIFEETCGLGLAMEFNGDLFSCDHFVEPSRRLGNIVSAPMAELVNDARQYRFGMDKRDTLPAYCRECEVRFMCNGGCPKDRVLRTPAGEAGLNALCAGYRSFFNYVDRPMKLMAALLKSNRAPAEIMRLWANEPRLGEAAAGSLCPCGSGRGVEDCHGAAVFRPKGHAQPVPYEGGAARKRRH